MRYCKNCNLKFNGKHEKCLFCGSLLEEKDDNYLSAFPDKKPKSFYVDRVKKIVSFCLLILIAVSVLLEYYIFDDRLYWVLVTFSSVYLYLCLSVSLNFSKGLVAKISNISMFTSLEVIGVFLFFGFNIQDICLSYVFPGICAINIIASIIIYLITKGKYVHDEFIYIIMNALYGLIPLGLVIFDKVNITFICSICGTISILTILAFIFFIDKETKEEFKRRFHI